VRQAARSVRRRSTDLPDDRSATQRDGRRGATTFIRSISPTSSASSSAEHCAKSFSRNSSSSDAVASTDGRTASSAFPGLGAAGAGKG